jgi:hypothetical protein
MSTDTVTPPHGATAAGVGAVPHSRHPFPHPVGDTLRAVRVFAAAAFNVAVLGEYAEEAGVMPRHLRQVPAPRSG